MIRSARWNGMALPILCIAIAACGSDARPGAADPNAPAVVKAPPPVLPGDTVRKQAKPATTDDNVRITLVRNYAVLGAAFAMRDPKPITWTYAPAAELITPNGTFKGQNAILKEFGSFGMDGSVKEFSRKSLVTKVVDNTVVDSGTFTVVRKARSGSSTTEHGAYASAWLIRPAPSDWIMTRDHLYPTNKR